MSNHLPTTLFPSAQEAQDRPSKFARVFEASRAIELEDAWHADSVGYINRVMVQATLPYREPKPRPGESGPPQVWGRRAGNVSLVIQPLSYLAEVRDKNGTVTGQEPRSVGYPYGTIPRLILAWLGREVRRQKTGRELYLGSSLRQFMSELGIDSSTGGANGSITRLREQMKRLFTARIALVVSDESSNPNLQQMFSAQTMDIAEQTNLWWDPKRPEEAGLFESSVVLSERFYREVEQHSVPVDMRALAALKGSPFELDMYCWLTYRFSYLRNSTVVPWDLLRQQFGSEAENPRKFKFNIRRALLSVKTVYPDARADPDADPRGLVLQPSNTSVRKYIKVT
jgi:hypothetical protein